MHTSLFLLSTILIVAIFAWTQNSIASAPNSSSTNKQSKAVHRAREKAPLLHEQKSKSTSNTTVTGTYGSGNNDLGSELKVKELAGKKMRFSLYSFWRCPDGTACNGMAEGTIVLTGKKAQYHSDDPEYTLKFLFSESGCTVECDKASNFGGFNVDPNGQYKRSSSKVVFD